MIDQGNLVDSLQQIFQNWIMTVLCVFKKWKSQDTAPDRSGQLDKTSWRMVQQVRPHHGEIFLDGNAQSVRYGDLLRDRSGQPDKINSQEVANSQNYIMGSDTTKI